MSNKSIIKTFKGVKALAISCGGQLRPSPNDRILSIYWLFHTFLA